MDELNKKLDDMSDVILGMASMLCEIKRFVCPERTDTEEVEDENT